VAFEFRGKIDHPAWRKLWDFCLVFGSFLPALLLGVAFANIFRGIPIDVDGIYRGTLFTLLNPYGILGGALFVCLFLIHGSLWLAIKAEGALHDRAATMAKRLWPVLVVVAVMFLAATAVATKLYDNYLQMPLLFVVPLLAVLALFMTRVFIGQAAWSKAWWASGLTIVAATLFGVFGLYPNLLPSSLDAAASATVANAASSPLTLKIMLVVALIFVPIVILYQAWVYRLFSGKLREEDLLYDEAH